jgi:hypothetical protein
MAMDALVIRTFPEWEKAVDGGGRSLGPGAWRRRNPGEPERRMSIGIDPVTGRFDVREGDETE